VPYRDACKNAEIGSLTDKNQYVAGEYHGNKLPDIFALKLRCMAQPKSTEGCLTSHNNKL
jgi:hypothetical protein